MPIVRLCPSGEKANSVTACQRVPGLGAKTTRDHEQHPSTSEQQLSACAAA